MNSNIQIWDFACGGDGAFILVGHLFSITSKGCKNLPVQYRRHSSRKEDVNMQYNVQNYYCDFEIPSE